MISAATQSNVAAQELRLKIPPVFARYMARRQIFRISLLSVFYAVILTGIYWIWRHQISPLSMLLAVLPSFWMFKPWISGFSFSNNSWIYAFNDRGIFLKDTANVILGDGFPILLWKKQTLRTVEIGSWQDYPALFLTYSRKDDAKIKDACLVYTPDQAAYLENTVRPWLLSRQSKSEG